MNNSPIGVFDSGMGGLSVWRELRRTLPDESLIYFGDGKNCPYGSKSDGQVGLFIDEAVRELLAGGVKLIVLACNTATMVSINDLRERYDIPFIGMEPAVKPAVDSTRTGVVGVLATRTALESEWFAGVKETYGGRAKIVSVPGTGFVEAVESGEEEFPPTLQKVRLALEPLLEAGADRIVLGCTHYPLLEAQLREVIGDRDVRLIDPTEAIVRRVEWILDNNVLRAEPGHRAEYGFLTFGGDDYRRRLERKATELSERQ